MTPTSRRLLPTILTATLLVAACSSSDAGGAAAPTPSEADIAYADVSASQVLDLWLPENATGPAPLIVWIHGGAFKGGSKDMIGAEAQPMLDAGFAVRASNTDCRARRSSPPAPRT